MKCKYTFPLKLAIVKPIPDIFFNSKATECNDLSTRIYLINLCDSKFHFN